MGKLYSSIKEKALHWGDKYRVGEKVSLKWLLPVLVFSILPLSNVYPKSKIVLSSQEKELAELINQDRVNKGLEPLALDWIVIDVSREHSNEMVVSNYLAPISPTKGDPEGWLAGKRSLQRAAAIIAKGKSVKELYKQISHYRSYLKEISDINHDLLGVGIVKDPSGYLIATVCFVTHMPRLKKLGPTIFVNLRGDTIPSGRIDVKFKREYLILPREMNEIPPDSPLLSKKMREICKGLGVWKIEKIFKNSSPEDTIVISFEGAVRKSPDLSRYFIIHFSDTVDITKVVKLFESLPEVLDAHPSPPLPKKFGAFHSTDQQLLSFLWFATPNDLFFSGQWGLREIRAPDAWDLSKGGNVDAGVIIGIPEDGGVDLNHEDLKAHIVSPSEGWGPGYDLHHTHVAGIAAAVTDNDTIGIAGMAWHGLILSRKYYSAEGVLEEIRTCANLGAKVINMSWGWEDNYPGLYDACKYAWDKGVVLVAAAGNQNQMETFPGNMYPAKYDIVLSVGATDSNDTRLGWSNYGGWLDVMAPGMNIYTTDVLDKYIGYF